MEARLYPRPLKAAPTVTFTALAAYFETHAYWEMALPHRRRIPLSAPEADRWRQTAKAARFATHPTADAIQAERARKGHPA